ncbi:hypothetical protein BDZ89DRAFT_954091, partial [Hymenopellis radicata]
GKPRGESWNEVVQGIPRFIEARKRGVRFPKKMCVHRRGRFPAPASGVGYGGGEEYPVNRACSKSVRSFMDDFIAHPLVQRLSGWINCLFRTHNPLMYHSYADTLDAVTKRDHTLRRNFVNSVFSLITVNVGPRTVTIPHRDRANRPPGWCPVSPFGLFDPNRSAQLVLDEFKLVIDFPAGTSIFIPSAIVTHWNLPLAQGETRYSITQYSPGGLFRWVYHGFRTKLAFEHEASDEILEQAERDHSTRWMDSLKYFPKIM